MNLTRQIRRAVPALLIVGATSVAAPPPADAACVVAYLAVHNGSAPDQVLVDPSTCLAPTPLNGAPLTTDAGTNGAPIVPGTPTGFTFQVWVPT